MAEPSYTAGEGTATQLPRGEAQALNEGTDVQAPESATVAPTEAPEAAAPEEAPDLELAEEGDYEPVYAPSDEDSLFLTGPTTRPGEPVSAGVTALSGQKLDPALIRALPDLSRAAQQPGASPNLLQLVAYLTREANR